MPTVSNISTRQNVITRTIALGNIDPKLKKDFTNVLRGNLALSRIKFLYGCSGQNLDVLARQYLWNAGLDYNHGTGHGVGYLLSIHEAPCRIRWQQGFESIPLSLVLINFRVGLALSKIWPS